MLPIRNILIVLSSVSAVVAYIIYFISILKGKAKPHRTTRLVLFVISFIATASMFAQGNRVAIWLSGVFAVSSFVIFLTSLKYGIGGFSKLDIFCFVIALSGIILWGYTNNPTLALFSSIAADFTGFLPTIIKTYRMPESEIWPFFFIGAVSAALNLLATEKPVIEAFAYPLYIIIVNGLEVLLILRPVFSRKK
jgi:membrane-associated HD superfamily phosphohydrolase